MASEAITIQLESEEKALILKWATIFDMSVSEFMRKAALECIEEEIDHHRREANAELEADFWP